MDPTHYMLRAMRVALLGRGRVSPNPLVGCVIVGSEGIVAEGAHLTLGGPHAEVATLARVKVPAKLNDSSMFVNLEPCAHHGKTPPCVDAILRARIPKVFISTQDPDPRVQGKGADRLREGGVQVEMGVMEPFGKALNRRFITFQTKKRPYIILKWAQSAGGYLSGPGKKRTSLTGPLAQQLSHSWRAQEDAILIGYNTLVIDKPSLNVRNWSGKNPVPIILMGSKAKTDPWQYLPAANPDTIFVYPKGALVPPRRGRCLFLEDPHGVRQLMRELFELNIQSVLVEGGLGVLSSFIDQDLWDEARIFESPDGPESGLKAPLLRGILCGRRMVGRDSLSLYECRNGDFDLGRTQIGCF